nr:Ras GTPase activating protein ira2 [Polyrhizophydium stewartii]
MLIDPPKLEDAVASQLLAQALRFFFTPTNNINLDTFSHSSPSPNSQFNNMEAMPSEKFAFLPTGASIATFYKSFLGPATREAISDAILSIANLDAETLDFELEFTASIIIYYLSASNWPIVLARIKAKIASFYQQAPSTGIMSHISSNHEGPDMDLAELRMIECCHLDSLRLSSTLSEITPHLKVFSKKATAVAVVAMRKAIWNWIEAFPLEFSATCQSKKNLEGHPEVLFDFLHISADSARKRSLYWPTQAMLLLLSAEDLFMYTNTGASGPSVAKKIQFLESLKKSLKTKNYDTAVLCYSDLCKAATFVNKTDGASLRILISSFETELKEKLFDPARPVVLSPDDDTAAMDEQLLSECLASLFKLNPLNTLRNVLPVLIEPGVPPLYRVLFIKCCANLVGDPSPLPWNPPIDVALADYIRHLFIEYVSREKPIEAKGKKVILRIRRNRRLRQIMAEESERSEIILNALSCWAASPTLAIVRDSTTISTDELLSLLQAVTVCLVDPLESTRAAAARMLMRVFDPLFVPHWDGCRPDWRADEDSIHPSEASMRTVWRVSSAVLLSIARLLLDLHAVPEVDADIVKDVVTLLCDLLYSRNAFLRMRSAAISPLTGSNIQERFAASVSLEISLLFLVCSPNQDVSRIATVCFQRLVEEADITGEAADLFAAVSNESSSTLSTWLAASGTSMTDLAGSVGSSRPPHGPSLAAMPAFPIVHNMAVYRELALLFEGSNAAEGALVMSNKAQQKVLRKALQLTERPTPGNLGAWEEVYRRWRILSHNMLKTPAPAGPVIIPGLTGPGDKMLPPKLDDDEEPQQQQQQQQKTGRFMRHKLATSGRHNPSPSASTANISQPAKISSDGIFGLGEDQAEWHNYTGFLCALGNVCLLASQLAAQPIPPTPPSSLSAATGAAAGQAINGTPTASSASASSGAGMTQTQSGPNTPTLERQNKQPQVQRALSINEKVRTSNLGLPASSDDFTQSQGSGNSQDPTAASTVETLAAVNWNSAVGAQLAASYGRARQTVERFVRELVELMTNESPVVRDAVRELLASEASGGLYGMLFVSFEKTFTSVFATGADDVCSDRNVLTFETILSVTRAVLDRADELYYNPARPSESTSLSAAVQLAPYSIDFAWIVLYLTRFINRLAVVPAHAQLAQRSKIRLCQLLELLMQKREIVGVKQDVLFRNRMVQILLEWNSEFGLKPSSDPHGSQLFLQQQSQSQTAMSSAAQQQTQQQSQSQQGSGADAVSAKATAELDEITMRVMVILLDSLPLMPVSELDGVLAEVPDDEDNNNKSRLFSTNLTFFLKVLQTCKMVETVESSRQQTPELRALMNRSKESTQHLALLKDNTIKALSNLISANIKAGLKYSLSIAYHEDPRTRAAFMHVLANLLEGGSVSGLLNGDWQDSKYTKLLELLTDDDLAVVLTLCDVSSSNDIDDIATALLSIFEKCGKASRLISVVIEDEINHTDMASGIFRRNSIATKLLTLYARSEAQDFLHITLLPILRTLAEMNPPMPFEIDPTRLEPTDNIETNMGNLKSITQDFLLNIFGNVSHFPFKLRLICANVAEAVARKFPDAGLLGVGAFVFLRFICPAIVAPETHALVKQPISQRELRRGLILVTKVIQNLANKVLFGTKEGFMIGLNDLLDQNQASLTAFLREISAPVALDRTIDDPPISLQADELTLPLSQMHRFLENYIPKMERAIAGMPDGAPASNVSRFGTIGRGKLFSKNLTSTDFDVIVPRDTGSPGDATGTSTPPAAQAVPSAAQTLAAKRRAALDRLSIILVQLGPASNLPEPQAHRAAGHSRQLSSGAINVSGVGSGASRTNASRAFQDFMQRQATLPTKSTMAKLVRDQRIFYEAGVSLENRPVFYLITRKITPEALDMDMLIHVIFEMSQGQFGRPFDLVLDMTFVGAENEWSPDTLHTLEKIMPPEARQNLHTLFILHANSFFKTLMKHAPRLLHSRMAKRTVFAANVKELTEYIARDKLHLPKTTLNIYDHPLTSYSPAQVHLFKGSTIPVTLMISQDVLIVQMVKKQEIMGMQPPIVDIFRISDIRDVGVSQVDPRSSSSEAEFFVKFHDKSSASSSSASAMPVLYLSSSRRDTILQALRASIARFQLSRPPMTADERDVSPRDLPGTLLNIALLNLYSEEPSVRVASYDLLCAIVSGFGYNVGAHLHSTKGIAIPFNSYRFVIDISTTLAASETSLTFEVLNEGLLGYPKLNRELKMHMLEYLSPWLSNLAHYLRPADSIETALQIEEAKTKVTQLLATLTHLTLKEQDTFLVTQSKIWSVLAQQDVIVPAIIDMFIEAAMQLPFGAKETEVLANTVVTLAGHNGQIVAGTIMKSLRQAVASTAQNPRTSMVDHPAWRLIQVLLRFVLMLSFDNKLCLQLYLADLFHVLSLVAGLGVPIVRRTVHGIVLNTLQVLMTNTALNDVRISGLSIALDKLHSTKFTRLFGLSNIVVASSNSAAGASSAGASAGSAAADPSASGAPSPAAGIGAAGGSALLARRERFRDYSTPAFIFNNDTVQGESVRELHLSEIEFFISTLIDIITYGAANVEICSSWKTRWISLAARTAFEDNFTAQVRSFYAIGSLAKDGFDSDLLHQTLVALRSSLLRFEDNKPQLVQSVVSCLCASLHSAPSHEQIIVPMFWLAIGLIQVGYIPFFLSGLNLLQVVLRLVDENPALRGSHLMRALLSGRSLINDSALKLDHETLIYFGEFLSFSISASLLKGMSNVTLKKSTTAVLTTLMELSAGTSTESEANDFSRDTLGFLLALLPTTDNPDTLLNLAGVARTSGWDARPSASQLQPSSFRDLNFSALNSAWCDRLLDALSTGDPTVVALMLVMLQVMLEASEFEPEVLQIYRFLAALAERSPQAFSPIYPRLITRFSNILLTTKSALLSGLVHTIFQAMSRVPPSETVKPQEDLTDIVNRTGFVGLFSVLSPDQQLNKETKQRRVVTLCEVIEAIAKSGLF